jgi:hypothetical protein
MLRVSDNRRFLVNADGSPFFFLADTGWTLLHRLDRDETVHYLDDRAAKGFTVIQVMGISEFDGLSVPNALGDLPFHAADPARSNEAYFRHVDWVVEQAANRGLHLALLPTWGDKVGPRLWGTEPQVFTPENAEGYGAFLGARYRDAPIVWVIGGDRNPVEPNHYATWRALAAGLWRGGAEQPMTFHPQHHASSADFFHDDSWLAFNMTQSGHSARDLPNHAAIERDYARVPIKPCMDGAACYEDHAVNWDAANGYFDDHDSRKTAYWALFAGAHGHTYGANGVFQFWKGEGEGDRFGVRLRWEEALALPGAAQMGLVRRLIESRPMLSRVPDQALLASDPGTGGEHVRATRGADGAYAFVYTPTGRSFAVDLGMISGDTVEATWYDPRTGEVRPAGTRPTMGAETFAPPTSGPKDDWILVLDDADRRFPPPGSPAK